MKRHDDPLSDTDRFRAQLVRLNQALLAAFEAPSKGDTIAATVAAFAEIGKIDCLLFAGNPHYRMGSIRGNRTVWEPR